MHNIDYKHYNRLYHFEYLPLPGGDKGRIGMDISPANPEIIYAVVEGSGGGFYKSTNRGASWQKMSSTTTSGNYYQEVVRRLCRCCRRRQAGILCIQQFDNVNRAARIRVNDQLEILAGSLRRRGRQFNL